MRILTTYCAHCDANVLTHFELDDSVTTLREQPELALPVAWLACPHGHRLGRFGVRPGTDEALDILLKQRQEAIG